jgi:hypothetical protein
MESLLLITGTMGAGKTSVMREASDILARRQIVHAAIDLDALGTAHLPSNGGSPAGVISATPSDGVMYENLRSVCWNYAVLGVQRFLVARAFENAAQLKLCREIIPAVHTMVCRLTASLATMERRVEIRDSGISQLELVARVPELNAILDRARLEDFVVANENRLLTQTAIEMLVKAGWIAE